jgi:hypothetical protein
MTTPQPIREFKIVRNGASGAFQVENASERKEKTVRDIRMARRLAETIRRERRAEAEKHRLLQQVQAGQPGVLDRLGRHIGQLVIAVALTLKLR